MARKTNCTISIDGREVSSAILPLLHSLSINDKAGSSTDTIDMTLDDTDGQIIFPRDGVRIEVRLGDENAAAALTYRGIVDEVRSTGSRSSGKLMMITGKGFDTKGRAKESRQRHWDSQTLGSVFADAARSAGVTRTKVDDALAGITRSYWAMNGESFLEFGERLACEVGATFKVSDDTAILVARSGGRSASGQTLPTVIAEWGVNLISWDVAPVIGRTRYAKTMARWYDMKSATWKTEEVEVGESGATAELTDRFSAADAAQAKKRAESLRIESTRENGSGSIVIDGNASAQPEGQVELRGARAGIDGTYRVEAVNHDYSRSGGWTTKIDLKEPQGAAGTDTRRASRKT